MGKHRVDGAMDVDEDADENDSLGVSRSSKSLLHSAMHQPSLQRLRCPRAARIVHASRHALWIVPGYTVLNVDTNILLSSLSMVASLIEGLRWMIICPLLRSAITGYRTAASYDFAARRSRALSNLFSTCSSSELLFAHLRTLLIFLLCRYTLQLSSK